MLTGKRVHDDISTSNGDFSLELSADTRPRRNQNTRRAIKETRTSEKAPAIGEMGNCEPKGTVSPDAGHNTSSSHQVDDQQPIGQLDKIQLGDYCLPPDKKEETLGGIKSCKTTEYADPYETKKMVEALRLRRQRKSPRLSAPPEEGDPFTYDLAKPIDDCDTKSNNEHFRHTYCEGSTPVSGTSVDSGVEDPDDYDHTVTWLTKGKNRMAQVLPNVNPVQTQSHVVHDAQEVQNSSQNSSPVSKRSEQVYAGPYEDPWDSSGSQQKFEEIVGKAKLEYRKKSQSDNYEEPVTKSDAYEEAWDLKSKEKDFELKVEEAHRRMSEGSKNLSSKGREWNASKKQSPSKPQDLVYSTAYEDPWDIKQQQRELAFQKQLSNVIRPEMSPVDDVPNFHAPPPPNHPPQNHPPFNNSNWDELDSPRRSTRHSVDFPNTRRQSEGVKSCRTDFAERIDPGIPLDIQKFYHGKISRKRAEELLVIHKEGSYLVRRSETQANVFSLSLKGVGGMPMHLRISLEQGMYILGENSKPFPTVPEMIDYYTQYELPVLKADRIKLLHPIRNKV